jgi:hypothetical protein
VGLALVPVTSDSRILSDGTTLTAYIGVAWLLFGYPLGRIFVSDKVEDTVRLAH